MKPETIQVCACLLLAARVSLGQDFPQDEVDEAASRIEWFGDLRLRGDVVRDLPRPAKSDFERATARLRLGLLWHPQDALEIGLAGKVNLSSQENSQTRFNLDNEKADDISLDKFYLAVDLSDNSGFLIGQSVFPLELSPMLWDQDLRPQGISLHHRVDVGDFSSLEMLGGAFLGNHLYGDDSQIRALQAALRIGEGTRVGYDFIVSYLDFNDLDDLAPHGLGRTNILQADGTLAHDFNIADLQFAVNFVLHDFPVRARVDLLKNLAVGDQGYGGRIDLIFGGSIRNPGPELGVATQRIQREALAAAFNDDDWWFRTRMRGTSVWLGYGFNESLRMRLAGFTERLDGASHHNQRVLLDLEWFF